jgi:hypothetical protein
MSDSIYLDEDDDEKEEPLFVGGSIFDDDMVTKYTDSNGRPRWKCKWCNNDYSG